ncbi:MAG: transcriptional repressor [Candidatus Fimivivens sp.]
MKYSKQRACIMDALRNTDEHPTAETIYRQLKENYPRLSLATVYRNLNQLCETGVIKKLYVAGSSDRFDANVEEHFHLCCKLCNKIIDVMGSQDAWRALLSERDKHCIDSCNVIFYGTCGACVEECPS